MERKEKCKIIHHIIDYITIAALKRKKPSRICGYIIGSDPFVDSDFNDVEGFALMLEAIMKTVKTTVKKLKDGNVYSFKVRPYTKVNDPSTGKVKKVYGKWSKAKKVKAKK